MPALNLFISPPPATLVTRVCEHAHLHAHTCTPNVAKYPARLSPEVYWEARKINPVESQQLHLMAWPHFTQSVHQGRLYSHFHPQTAKGERSASLGPLIQLLQMFMEEFDTPNLSQKLKKKRDLRMRY